MESLIKRGLAQMANSPVPTMITPRPGFPSVVPVPGNSPHDAPHIPVGGLLLLGVTVLFFGVCSFFVEYTFGRVIPTLLMIESPEAIVFEPLTGDDVDASLNKPNDPELLLVKPRPITASFRATLRHLRSKGGFFAGLRGLSMYIVYSIIFQFISGLLSVPVPFFFGPVVADVLCMQFSLAWTHIVISDPNPRPWYRRIPSYTVWRRIAGPTAIVSVAQQIAVVLPAYMAIRAGYLRMPHQDASLSDVSVTAGKTLSIVVLAMTLTLLVVVPAKVILTRVQASLLPDELESVVPFDRSFGGRVIPAIVGGSGRISMREAWDTFDWNARVRLIKAYIKAAAMQFVVIFLFIITAAVEVFLVFGKDFNKYFPGDSNAQIAQLLEGQ